MPKKNIKVKKDNNDISITIENNLNANNKQINNVPIPKRRRRKKNVENNDEIDVLQELPPLTDTSYIKPGPVGAFQMLRPAQPGAGAGAQEISFDNFQRFLAILMENQRNGNPANNVRPPPGWGRGLVDDHDVISRANTPPQPEMPELGIVTPPPPEMSDLVFNPDSGIVSDSSDRTDDDVSTLIPRPTLPPPKRPPLPSQLFVKLLKNMDKDKAAYYGNLYNNLGQNLMSELEEAGMDFKE